MASRHDEKNVSVGAADTSLIAANDRRLQLIIGSPAAAVVWLSFSGPAAVGKGIPLRPGTAPFTVFKVEGEFPFIEEVRAISEGAAENIGVIQVLR